MKRVVVLEAAAIVVCAACCAEPLAPTPAELFVDGALTDPQRNFSLRAPGEGWVWRIEEIRNGRVYTCRHEAADLTFIVITQDDGRRTMSARGAERFGAGMADSLRRQGFTVQRMERHDSDRPFAGAHRLVATASAPGGDARRVLSYVGVKDKLYGLQALVADEAGERQFEAFAASFGLLEPVPMFPPTSLVFASIVAGLFVLGWWLLFVRVRWSAVHQRARWPLALMSPLALTLPAANAWAVSQGGRTIDELDHALGQAAGVLLVVVLFAFVTSVIQRGQSGSAAA
jgi:hypothetical protein